jgi:hypothetical protein
MLRYIRRKDPLDLVRDFVAWLVPGIVGKALAFIVFGVFVLVSWGIDFLRLWKLFS